MSNPKEELTQIFQNVKPLRERPKGIHTSDSENNNEKKEEEEEQKDNEKKEEEEEEEEQKEESKNKADKAKLTEEDNNEEEQEEEDKEEKRILEREPEEKITKYINEILKRIIKGENMLDDMKTFMDFVRINPNNIFDENSEYYATVLSNATINGVKLFDDVDAARDFINDIRNKRRSKKWLRPKAQKQIKQEIQKNLQISPMMLKNIKHRTNAINVYQY